MKIALIQTEHSKNKQENINNLCELIKISKNHNADLAVLSELHNTRYFCQTANPENFDLAEDLYGETFQIFSKLAKELKILIVCSIFEKRDLKGLYSNTAFVLENTGELAGIYRKMHIPNDPDYYEKYYFSLGDLGFKPISTSLGKLGVLICFDQWFPEAARSMSLNGADILIYPTAIGWCPSDLAEEKQKQLDAWVTVQRGHAIANAIPLVSVNRKGFEANPDFENNNNINKNTGIEFWGNSFACGPQGEIITSNIININNSDIFLCEINPEEAEQVRRVWTFFRDRRTDFYK